MATSSIKKVLTFFEGMENRDPGLVTKYVHPTKYREHNPFAADGVAGLKAYISGFLPHNHHVKVIRSFQDGPYVFTQADGEVLGQNTFFDVFRFEDDWIVEHWTYSAKAALPNKSGHTQTDGPTEAKQNGATEKNKAMVRDYYQTFHIAGNHNKVPQYFSGDLCIRHEPGVIDGVAAFLHDVEAAKEHRSIDEIKMLLGQGDFVFITAQGSMNGDACVYVDLYRVEDEKIIEHWGFIENIPPPEELKNGNSVL